MTNETKHTPTPWDQLNDVFTIEDGYFSMIQTPDQCIANVFDEANAAHIVKCVNMHDELVEALEAAANSSGFQYMFYETREKINAALAKARGEV